MNWPLGSWAIFALALAWPAWFAGRRLVRRRRRRRRCEACAYDLRGRASDRCPECGHDVTGPLRLIRVRAVLLHGTIMIALLAASHLVNRIEAIQKRGWIAAVPTTVLLLCMPFDGRPSGSGNSITARELLNHRTADPHFLWNNLGARDSGSDYPMTGWQWWLAVEMAISCDFAIHGQRTEWMANAERILIAATVCHEVTGDQMQRVLDLAFLKVHTRPEWPLGVEIHARFGSLARGLGPWVGLDYVARPYEEDASLMSFDVAAQMELATSTDWRDCSMSLGKPRSIGPIEYQFIAWREDPSIDTWNELHREVQVITAVVPAETQILQSMSIGDEVISSIGVKMRIWKHFRFGSPQCAIVLRFVGNRRFLEAVGDGTFAVRIRLKHDGQVVAERYAWWSKRMGWAPVGTDEWTIGLVVDHDLVNAARESGDHLWSFEIEGDPILALRDFESTSYWAGKHEFRNIPVEREER